EGVGPEVGRSSHGPSEAAVVVAKLQQPDDLVAAPRIRAGQRIVDERGAAESHVRVLVGPRTRRGWKWSRPRATLAEGLGVEVAHHAEDLPGAIVVTAVDVARFRAPQVCRH